jgi:hypothetical protein
MSCCAPHVNGGSTVTPPSSSIKVFQSDGTQTQSTTSTTPVTWRTTSGITEILDTEEWKINWCVNVCHPSGVPNQNTYVRLQVETSSGVFATFDDWQVNWGITISGGTRSCPGHRTKKLTASMDNPRFRFQVFWNVFTGINTFVEEPRVGGVLIPA